MTEQEINAKELLNEFNKSLNGWFELEPFTQFVESALTKHLFEVMNSENKNKPTFEQWEDLKVNSDSLITMLERLTAYQECIAYRITMNQNA
jgi:hypothetical protein